VEGDVDEELDDDADGDDEGELDGDADGDDEREGDVEEEVDNDPDGDDEADGDGEVDEAQISAKQTVTSSNAGVTPVEVEFNRARYCK